MRTTLASAVAVLLASMVVVGAPGTAGAASPETSGVSIPGFRLARMDQAQLDLTMDRVAATGVKWLRTDVVWGDIEASPGEYRWSYMDRVVAGARARGLHVLGIATVLPSWARPPGMSWNYGPRTDFERSRFAAFVELAAARYAGTIDTWEVWNEPNLTQFWSPSPSPSDYSQLLKAAHPAIHRGNPHAKVLTGGTGWAVGGADIETVNWYTSLYALGARSAFDGVSVHPYSDPENLNSGEMVRALSVRHLMDSKGDAGKQLWATENGATTSGGDSTSEPVQAAYLSRSHDVWDGIANAGPLFWHTLRDAGGGDREGYFGLLRQDGSAKPSYWALQQRMVSGGSAGSPATAVEVSSLSAQAGSGTTVVSFTLRTAAPMHVDRLQVAIRDAGGNNKDILTATSITLNGSQAFASTRSLAPGTYSYRIAHLRGGTWTDLDPTQYVVVPGTGG